MVRLLKSSIAILLIIAFTYCNDNDDVQKTKQEDPDSILNLKIRSEIFWLMESVYYWYNKIPSTTDTLENISPVDFYYSMLYTTLDKWSFMLTTNEMSDFEKGIYYGHGMMFNIDEYGQYRVAFVFKGTTAYKMGVRRGLILKRINGQEILNMDHMQELLGADSVKRTNTFEFVDPISYDTKKYILTKETIYSNPVLADTIFTLNDKKIGYLALESFLADSFERQLDKVFYNFNQANINELVIDLRYNSGGSLDAAAYLASLITGNIYENQIFIRTVFNDQLDKYIADSVKISYIKKLPNSLNKKVNKIFFITSYLTASASEALIKGVQPYFNSLIIGTRTAGKPVGMIPFTLETADYVLLPITFEWKNTYYESCGYTGIGVDHPEFDDLNSQLGNPNELCLKDILYYISNDNFPSKKKSAVDFYDKYRIKRGGINAEIGAY